MVESGEGRCWQATKPPLSCPQRPLTGKLSPPTRGAVLAQSEGCRVRPRPGGLEQHRGSHHNEAVCRSAILRPPLPSTPEWCGRAWPQPPLASLLVSAPQPPPKSKHSQEAPAHPDTRTVGGVASQGTVLGVGGTEKHRGVNPPRHHSIHYLPNMFFKKRRETHT